MGTYGTLLFDLQTDPHQRHNLADPAIERSMAEKLKRALEDIGAPKDVFERLGLQEG